ncbi:MAG: hypothetical protein LBL74_01645 [Bacteroidales bacterium]|jgi:hypothetical protein|nr:hypothetical protein [Bacteroidales bacterium]
MKTIAMFLPYKPHKTALRLTKHIIILLIVAFISSSNVFAQRIKVEISKDTIYIGQRITLSFSLPVTGDALDPVVAPTDTLEMLSASHNIIKQNDKSIARFEAIFTSFIEGRHSIPSLTIIEMDSARNKERKYYTDSINFVVAAYPVDTAKIEPKDIKPILEEKFTISEIAPLLWALLGLIAVSVGVFFLIRYLKHKQPLPHSRYKKPEPKEPADVRALKALEDLKSKHLSEQGQKKSYYSEMTDILRNFLTEGFGVYAMEMTTSEIISSLQMQLSKITDEENLVRLRYILSTADLVKFAKYEPDGAIDDKCLTMSKDFIVKTKFADKEEKEDGDVQ